MIIIERRKYLQSKNTPTIDLLDSKRCRLLRLKVHKSIAFRDVCAILRNLAAQNVTESRECIVECLVVDRLVQILDEDVANARLAERWIALGPHDANGTAFDQVKVHGVENSFG